MGFTRKMMSASTMGLVDWRSDKERTAAYSRGVRREARKQTKIMKGMAASAQPQPTYAPTPSAAWPPPGTAQPAASTPPPPPSGPTAGWYPDQTQPGVQRYFDGVNWTDHTAPTQARPLLPSDAARLGGPV